MTKFTQQALYKKSESNQLGRVRFERTTSGLKDKTTGLAQCLEFVRTVFRKLLRNYGPKVGLTLWKSP